MSEKKKRSLYKVSREITFSSAHAIKGHHGGCENLHGHNWRVRVTVSADELDEIGMVIDYKDLKAQMTKLADKLDHNHLNNLKPFNKLNPTSENIARYFFEEISKAINNSRINVISVEVWESEHSCASYGIE